MDQTRVRVTGTFRGRPFVYESPDKSSGFFLDRDGAFLSFNHYYFDEGNFACDCNRAMFLPEEMYKELPIGTDEFAGEEYYCIRCGEQICIDKIEALDSFPGYSVIPLELNETPERIRN